MRDHIKVPRKPGIAAKRRRPSVGEGAQLPFWGLLADLSGKTRLTSITYQKKCKNDTFLHFLTKCKQRRHPKAHLPKVPHCSHFSPKKYFLHGVGSNNAPYKTPRDPTSFWAPFALKLAEVLSGLKSRGSRRLLAPRQLKTHDEFDRPKLPKTSPAWSKSNLKPPKLTPKRRVH